MSREVITEAIAVVVAKYEGVLKLKFPEQAGQINSGIVRILHDQTKPNFVSAPTNVIDGSQILTSLYGLDPALTDRHYANKIVFMPDRGKMFYPDYEHDERDQVLEPLFRTIINVGGLKLDRPEARIIAAFFMGKLAEKAAFDDAKIIRKAADSFSDLTGADKIPDCLGSLRSKKIRPLRDHLAFIDLVSVRTAEVAAEAGLGSEQVQLLQEVASLRGGLLGQQGYIQAIEPIVRSIAQGDWKEAVASRDFLLRCLPKAFPPESRDNGYICSAKTQNVYKKLMNERMLGSVGMSPEEAKDVIRRCPGLPKEIAVELDKETRLSDFRRYLNRKLGRDFADATSQIFSKYQNKNQRQEEFTRAAARIGAVVGESDFEDLQKKYETILVIQVPPYILRTGHDIFISKVEVINGKVVYYSRFGSYQDITGDFGQLLFKIIKVSLGNPTHGILDSEQVQKALRQAYRIVMNKDSSVAELSLNKYVAAMFLASGITLSTQSQNIKISKLVAGL